MSEKRLAMSKANSTQRLRAWLRTKEARRTVSTQRPRLLHAESLEPRFLLSGEAMVVPPVPLVDPHAPLQFLQSATAIQSALPSVATAQSVSVARVDQSAEATKVNEIFFVDPQVKEYSALISEALKPRAGQTEPARVEVVVLDGSQEGIGQISDWLKNYQGLQAVHLLSHGDDASLRLGTTTLNENNLDIFGTQLTGWRSALAPGADLLLYGCDVGKGEEGSAFINHLAKLTGSDVAASVDGTGSADLGGNWVLEKSTGSIDVRNPFAHFTGYQSLMATTTPSISGDSTLSVFTKATAKLAFQAANNLGAQIDSNSEMGRPMPMVDLPFNALLRTSDGRTLGDILSFRTLQGTTVLDDFLAAGGSSTADLMARMGDYLNGIGAYSTLESVANRSGSSLSLSDDGSSAITVTLTLSREFMQTFGFGEQLKALGLDFLPGFGIPLQADVHFTGVFDLAAGTIAMSKLDAQVKVVDPTFDAKMALGVVEAEINGGTLNFDTGKIEFDPVTAKMAGEVKLPTQPGFASADMLITVQSTSLPEVKANASFDLTGNIGTTPIATIAGGTPQVNVSFGGLSLTSAESHSAHPTLSGVATLQSDESLQVTVGTATYDVTPAQDATWTLDLSSATPTSGTLNLTLGSAIEVKAQIVKTSGGKSVTSASGTITVYPTVDEVITNSVTPTLSGYAKLGSGQSLSVNVGGATYSVIPNATTGLWTLNLANLGTSTKTSGTLTLSNNPSTPYTVTATVTGLSAVTGELTIDTSLSSATVTPVDADVQGETTTGSVVWASLQTAPLVMTSDYFSNLQAISSLTAPQIVNMLTDLGTYLSTLRDSGSFDALLPFTELSLGQTLDFSAAINDIINKQLATTVSSGIVAGKAISPVLNTDLVFDLQVQRTGDERVTTITVAVDKDDTTNFIHINQLAGLIGKQIAEAVDGWLAWSGTPIEVTETLKGGLSIGNGQAKSSESQTVTVHASSGSYQLSYNGSPTGDIDVMASPIEVQHALERVVGVGNVQVTGRTRHYLVDFIGNKKETDLSLLQVASSTLTTGSRIDVTASEFVRGGDGRTWGKINILQADPDDFSVLRLAPSSGVSLQQISGGSDTVEAVQRLYVVHGGDGSFILYSGDTAVSDPIFIDGLDASAAQTAIANALLVKLGNPTGLWVSEVTGEYAADNGTRIFDIGFGQKAGKFYAQGLLSADTSTANITVSETTAGGKDSDGNNVNEVQSLVIPSTRAGSFVLKGTTLSGMAFTTAPLHYNSSTLASDLQTALRAAYGLSSLTVVSVPIINSLVITFDANRYSLLKASNVWSTKIPAQVVASTEQIAAPPVGATGATNEVQKVIISNASGGSFVLGANLNALQYETSSISYGASAATVQSALLTMFRYWDSAVSSADVTVSKNGNVYSVEFTGRWSGKDIPQLRVNSSKLISPTSDNYSGLDLLGFWQDGQDSQVRNVTTFITLNEMVQRFQQTINNTLPSGTTFLVNPTFDTTNKTFTFNVRLMPTQTVSVPLTVSSEVGDLSSISTENTLDLTTQTLFQAAIGFDFSQLNTFALRASGTYSGKITAAAKNTTINDWSIGLLGTLMGSAEFSLAFNGENYDMEVTKTAVTGNTSRADLVSDFQSAFDNMAVSAGGVLARRGFTNLGQVVTVGKSDSDQLTFTIQAPIDQVQLTVADFGSSGFNPMGSMLGFRTVACYPAPKAVILPSNGQLVAGSAHFDLKVDQSDAISLVLSKASTTNNTSLDDLISDLNTLFNNTNIAAHSYLGTAGKGFSNLGQVVQAILRNGQIELVTQSAKVASLLLQITGNDPTTKELGFTPGQFATTTGAYVFLKDFSLDGGATYQKVTLGGSYSAVIHGQSGSTAANLVIPGEATLGMLDLTFNKLSADYSGSLTFNLRNGFHGDAHDAISLNDLFDSASQQGTLLGLGGKLSTEESISSPNAPFQSNGQLMRDVGLSVTVGSSVLEVTVAKSVTTTNTSVADLAEDVNAAIHTALAAKFTTDPYAGFQFVEADSLSVAGKTVLKFNAPTTTLSLATTPSQIYNATTGVLAINLPMTVALTGTNTTVDLLVQASNTEENSSLADLVSSIDTTIKLALASARNNTNDAAVKTAIDNLIYPVDNPTGLVSISNGVLTFSSAVTVAPISFKKLSVAARVLKDDFIENLAVRNQAGDANSTPTAALTFAGIGINTPTGLTASGLNSATVITIAVNNTAEVLTGGAVEAVTTVVPQNGLGILTPFKEVTWSTIKEDLSQLGALFGDLGDVGTFGELGRALPVLGTSVSDLFDFGGRLSAISTTLQGESGIGLTALAETLESAFGLSSGAVTLSYDATHKALNIDLPYEVIIDQAVSIELIMNDTALLALLSESDKSKLSALLGSMSRLKDVDSSAKLDLHADLTFHLALGLDMDDSSPNKGHLFLYDHQDGGSTGLVGDTGTYAIINSLHATATGVAFSSVQGIYSLGVTGGTVDLTVNSGSGLLLQSDAKDGAADGRLYLNRYAALSSDAATELRHADFTVIFDGSANVMLPMNLSVSDDLGQLAMEQIDGFINPLPLGKMELHFVNLGDSFAQMGGKSGFIIQSTAESSNSHTVISSQVQQAVLPERPATGNGSAVTTPEGAPIDSSDESGLSNINPNPYFGSTEGAGASTTASGQTVDITKLFATGPSVNPGSTGFDVSLIIPDFAYWQTQLTQVLNAAIGEKCDPEQIINGPLLFLLRDPTLIVDTVDTVLGGIQKGLDAFSSVLDLPIIGDKLKEATQFVVDLRKNVVGAIKKALDDAVDVYGGLDNALRMMLFKMLQPADTNHDFIVTAAEQSAGNPFLNFLQDYNGDELISPDDIVVEYIAGIGQPELDPALEEYLNIGNGGLFPAVLPGQRTAWVTSGINTIKTDSQGNQITHDDGSLCYTGKAGHVVLDSSLQKIVDDVVDAIDSVSETASEILSNITNNHGNGFMASAKAFVQFIIQKVQDGYDYQHLLKDVFGAGAVAATFADVLSEFSPSSEAIAADVATVKYNLDHNLTGANALIPKAVLNELKQAVQEKAEEIAAELALGSSTAIQFRMHLGQTYNPELNLSFDIGVPGLSLALDGGIGVKLDWDLYLGFGLDINDGFYLITNMPATAGIGEVTTYNSQGVATGVATNGEDAHIDNLWLVGKPTFTPAVKELQAQLDVYLSPGAGNTPAQLNGKLLFLNGTLTDNWDGWIKDNDTGIWGSGTDSMHRLSGTQNANYGRTTELFDGESGAEGSRTRLQVHFNIDLKDVGLFGISALSNFTNGRLTFADFRAAKLSDLFAVEWDAKAQINLHVQLGLSLDLSGNAQDSYLPTIIGDFHMTWAQDDENKYMQQIHQFLSSGYDKLFHTGQVNIWMSDIYLDVGTFFTQFLKPIVQVIQYVTDPIMPVIDALTAPIPGISDLMGRDYSIVDLASDMSAMFGGISKLDFIIAMINVLEVIGHLPTGNDVQGMMLPVKEAFIIKGSKDRKLNLSALPDVIPDIDIDLPYVTLADVHIRDQSTEFEFNLNMGVGWKNDPDTTLITLLQGNIPDFSVDLSMNADIRVPAPYIDVAPFDFTIDGVNNRDGTIAHFKLLIKAGWPHLMLSDILNGNMAPQFDLTLQLPDIDFLPNMLPLLRFVMPRLTATFNNREHTLLGGGEMNVNWPSWLQAFVDKSRTKTYTGPTANINLGNLSDFLMPLPYEEIGSTQFYVPAFDNPFTLKIYAGWKDKWFSDFLLGGMLPTINFEVELPSGFNVDTKILPVIKVVMPSVTMGYTISGTQKSWTIGGSTWTADWSSALTAFVDSNDIKTIDMTGASINVNVNFGSIDLRFLPTVRVEWPDVHWIALGTDHIWEQSSHTDLGWSSLISDAGVLSMLIDTSNAVVIKMPDVYLPSINLWDLLPDLDWSFSLPGLPGLPSINIDLPDINLPGQQTVSPKDAFNEFQKKLKKPGSALKFPILEDPVGSAIGMLKGEPVDLMTFTPPDLDVKVGFRVSFPVYPPVYVGIGGEIRLQASLMLGFDTYGIVKFANTHNLWDIFDGFYVGDHIVGGVDKPEITLTAKLYAFAELNAFIVRAGVEGGIKFVGTLDIYDENKDNRYRVSELLGAIAEDPLDVVEMHLRASAYVAAYVDLFAIFDWVRVWEQTFFDVTLFEWEHDPAAKKPILGSMSGTDLVLHMGSTSGSIDGQSSVDKGAKDRLRRSTVDGDEAFTLTGTGGSISISALLPNGQTYSKTFTGVSRVKAYAGEGNDLIDASAIDLPVLFIAGAGSDTLKGGSKDDVLIGSASGTATLVGGVGNDLFIVRGGTTHLDGGSGDDKFRFLAGWGVADITDATGSNILDFTAQTAAVTVDDSEGKAFQSANTVTWHNGGGGSGGGDTIDLIKGGTGKDILDFSGDEAPLLISITATNAGWVKGSGAGMTQTSFATDTADDMKTAGDNAGFGFKFDGFENIFGGQGSDVFRIKDGASLTGSLHGDTAGALHQNASGNEIANSRNILDFSEYTSSITVNEESTSAFGSQGATDIIVRGFHDIFGGSAGDRLSGDGRNNLLVGNDGTDLMEGKAGQDLLVADTFVTYANLTGSQARPSDGSLDRVTDYLTLQKAGSGQWAAAKRNWIWKGQTLESIALSVAGAQVLKGGSGNDVILGSKGGDIINIGGSGEGNDTIIADLGKVEVDFNYCVALSATSFGNKGGGSDTIYLGGGSNLVIAGNGKDKVTGADVASSLNIVLGDNGTVKFKTAEVATASGMKKSFAIQDGIRRMIDTIDAPVDENIGFGNDDTISLSSGSAIVLAGTGKDTIRFTAATSSAANIRFISGDHAAIRTDSHGGVTEFYTLDSEAATGGDDLIVVGSANDLAERHLGSNFILGGMGADTVVISGTVDTSGNVTSGLAKSEDLIFGDNGKMTRTASLAATSAANKMLKLESTETSNAQGGNDKIIVANGGKMIIAGVGEDAITSRDGDHLLIGDNGQVDYDSNNDGILRAMHNTVIDQGGNDTITMGNGFKVVLGGYGSDVVSLLASTLGDAIGPITVTGIAAVTGTVDQKRGRSGRYVVGDNAEILFDDQGGLTDIETIDTSTSTGNNDTITVGLTPATANTVDIGTNVLIGGMGNDAITVLGVDSTGTSFDTILGDNGEVHRNDYNGKLAGEVNSGTPYALRDVHSTYRTMGGDDTILTSMGNKVMVGGYGSDTVTVTLATAVPADTRFISGDNAALTFDRFGGMTDFVTTDTQAVTGGDDQIRVGSTLGNGQQFGTNLVIAGMAKDLVLMGGASWDATLQKLLAGYASSEDIVIGDNGEIHRAESASAGAQNYMLQAKTILGDQGANDIIGSGSGGKVMLAGFGSDRLTARDGDHLVTGDNAEANYDVNAKNGILRELKATEITLGGSDSIALFEGYKVVMGGIGGDSATYDTIDIAANGIGFAVGSSIGGQSRGLTGIDQAPSGASNAAEAKGRTGRFVVGDNATFTFDLKGGLTDIVTMDAIAATGGRDQIILGAQSIATGTDLGYQVVMGGMSTDSITVRSQSRSEDYLMGDNGEFHRTPSGYGLTALFSIAAGQGGADVISSGAGLKVVVGGDGADTITLATTYVSGYTERALVVGDSGEVRFDAAGGEMLESVSSFLSSPGDSDHVTVGDGDVAFIGGQAADSLTVNSLLDQFRIAVGDNATMQFIASDSWESSGRPLTGLTQLLTTDISAPTGGDDTIQIGYAGESAHAMGEAILVGGVGADSLKVAGKTADSLLVGDNVEIRRSVGVALGPQAVTSQSLDQGGADTLETPTGWHILIGGMAGDTIRSGKGTGVVLGDSGAVIYGVDGSGVSTGLLAAVSSSGLSQGGADTISLGAGSATTDGNQVVIGGFGADTINLVTLAGYERELSGDAADVRFDSYGHMISFVSMDVTAATGGNDQITVGVGGSTSNWPAAGIDINVVSGGIGDDRLAVNTGGYTVGVVSGDNLDYRRGRDTAGSYQHRFADALMPLLGGSDSILVGGGDQIVFGGFGNDTLETRTGSSSGERTILFGDGGTASFDTGLSGRIARAFSTSEDSGGDDLITIANGPAYLFGGKGNDRFIANGIGSERVAFGDNGQIDWDSAGALSRLQTTGSDALDATLTVDSFTLPLGANLNDADYSSSSASRNYIFGGPGFDTLSATADPVYGDDLVMPGTGSVSAPGQAGEVISVVLLGTYTGSGESKSWEFQVQPADYDPQRVIPDPDAPVTPGSGSVTGSVVGEGSVVENDETPANGQLAYPSVNGGNAQFQVNAIQGNYGLFTLNAAGRWSYTLDQDLADSLTEGQEVKEIFIARSTENSATTVTITITGENDTPQWTTPQGASYTDTSSTDTFVATSATLQASDSDANTVLSYGISGGVLENGISTLAGLYGTLTVDASSGAYLYTPDADLINDLTGNSAESFTVTVGDGLVTSSTTITVNLTGANDTPQLTTISSGSVEETAQTDTFSSISRTLSASDVDAGQSLTFGIQGGTVVDNVATLAGTYGTLTLNTATGALSYQPDATVINGLLATDSPSDSFTVTVSDGVTTVSRTFTVQISGANDVPLLASVSGASYSDSSADDLFSTTTRTLSATDQDTGQTLTYGIEAVTALDGVSRQQGSYGQLTVTQSGALSYVPDAAAINGLAAGASVTETFTVTVSDGSATVSSQFQVQLTGANDTPEWSIALNEVTYSDGSASDSFQDATASLQAGDRDSTQTMTYGMQEGTVSDGLATQSGSYGLLTVNTSSGALTYHPDSSKINRLTAGAYQDHFTLQASDGTVTISQDLWVTVNGANDQAEISLGASGLDQATLKEDVAASSANKLLASGSLHIADVDAGEPHFNTEVQAQGSVWGQLTMSADGQWSYQVDNALTSLQALANGQQHTESFRVYSADGTASHLITVVIQGSDEPVVNPEPSEEEKEQQEQQEQQQKSEAQAAAQSASMTTSSSSTSTGSSSTSTGSSSSNSSSNNSSSSNNGLQGQVLSTSSNSTGSTASSSVATGSASSGNSSTGINGLNGNGSSQSGSVNQQPSTVPLTQGASTFYNTQTSTTTGNSGSATGSTMSQNQASTSYSQNMSQQSATGGNEGGTSASSGANTQNTSSTPATGANTSTTTSSGSGENSATSGNSSSANQGASSSGSADSAGSSGNANPASEGGSNAPANAPAQNAAPGESGSGTPSGGGGGGGGESTAPDGEGAKSGGDQSSNEPQGEQGSKESADSAALDPLLGTAGMLAMAGITRPRIAWQPEAPSTASRYRRVLAVGPR
ncbi:MAG: DUF4347 domain-containing protein [Magnetococcales bacterium]|nr:DUF4347 domain-containing protein [Magnetococcales bacterium]